MQLMLYINILNRFMSVNCINNHIRYHWYFIFGLHVLYTGIYVLESDRDFSHLYVKYKMVFLWYKI